MVSVIDHPMYDHPDAVVALPGATLTGEELA